MQTLAESLDLAQRPEDAYFNKLVRIMATRCMTQAAYFGSGEVSPPEYYHYGPGCAPVHPLYLPYPQVGLHYAALPQRAPLKAVPKYSVKKPIE